MEELIVKYLTNTITKSELDSLMTWLGESEDNKNLFFDLKNIYDVKRLEPSEAEIENIWYTIQSTISQNQNTKRIKQRHTLLRYLSTSAAAVLLLISSVLFSKHILTNDKEPVNLVISEIKYPENESSIEFNLPDGSHVQLKKGSVFRLLDNFGSLKREVFLDGEAFFDVAKNEQKPFIVNTSAQKITVLGTSFNVKDYSDSQISITTLISGSVKLESEDMKYTLKPNDQFLINKKDKSFLLGDIPADLLSAFKTRKYHFKDKPLYEIFNDLNKLFSVHIDCQNPSITSIPYTGTISLNQNIDEILSILNYKKQFEYVIEERQNIIIK